MTVHYLSKNLIGKKQLSVVVAGCGGTGSQVVTGLAALDHALSQTSGRRLHVTVFDKDTVSNSNIGRQPFYPCDIGLHKAKIMIERLNHGFGLTWTAMTEHLKGHEIRCDLFVTCVDSAAARREFHQHVITGQYDIHGYWLDFGNRATDGQVVLGQSPYKVSGAARLKMITELFPQLLDSKFEEEDIPSCSLAEALRSQDLFINRTLASHGLSLLWHLLSRGQISHQGLFVNLLNGIAAPIPIADNRQS